MSIAFRKTFFNQTEHTKLLLEETFHSLISGMSLITVLTKYVGYFKSIASSNVSFM